MRIDEARALARTLRQRCDECGAAIRKDEAAVVQLAGQLRALAAQEPSAAVARKRSDLRSRKHRAEAELATRRELAEQTRRELARVEQAIAATERAAQARAAATPTPTPAPAPAARPVALRTPVPVARPAAGSSSSTLRPVVIAAGEPTPPPAPAPAPAAALPPAPRGSWRTAILPESEGAYGAKLGPYRIEAAIGSGSQAAVFLATDAIRQVALKLIDAAEVGQEVWKALRREARRLAAIRSDHVLAAYGFDEIEFQPDAAHAPCRLAYLALEYMDQGTLLHVEQAAGGRLDIPAAVDAVVQAATGIAAIHSAGVLHRDIKPQNIMATSRDGVQVYRVGDLGVAVEHDVEAIELTGTLAYLAPEVIAASRARETPPFSHASDIYGLGATLYRLVTGRTPVQALADAAGLQGKVHAADLFAGRSELPDPRGLRPDCPKPLAEILLRLTAIDPAARPPTAEDAAEAVQAALTAKRRLFPW